MKNSEYIESKCLPIINIELFTEQLAEFVLWYDKKYCKNLNGANEVIGEYLANEQLSDNEDSPIIDSCPQCGSRNIAETADHWTGCYDCDYSWVD